MDRRPWTIGLVSVGTVAWRRLDDTTISSLSSTARSGRSASRATSGTSSGARRPEDVYTGRRRGPVSVDEFDASYVRTTRTYDRTTDSYVGDLPWPRRRRRLRSAS